MQIEEYFKQIEKEVEKDYAVAEAAREKGLVNHFSRITLSGPWPVASQ